MMWAGSYIIIIISGLFGLAMSPRLPEVSAIDPNMLRWCKRHLPITGVNFRSMPPCSTLHGSHCLSCEFTRSAKLVLEKQTNQPSLVMALCMCSVQV